MSNWDDDDWENSQPELNNEPLGDWDDEDVAEEAEPELKKPSAPMKPKKALERALKEKEDLEQKREVERILTREKELAEMSAVERKLRQQQIVEEADLESAKDLFSAAVPTNMPSSEPTLDTFEPVTDVDYTQFARMIGERCCALNDNPRRTGRYVEFIKSVMRILTRDLGPDDSKDLSTFMGLLSNEKRDEFKRSKGIKKKPNKKASVRVDRADDVRDNGFDDLADDFM